MSPSAVARLTTASSDPTLEQIFGQRSGEGTLTELAASDAPADGLARLGLLASALSAGPLQVAAQQSGERSWTDGATVFVDPGADARSRLQALAVQASLLAAGSLAPEVVRKLARRPALARRYLAVEGHR